MRTRALVVPLVIFLSGCPREQEQAKATETAAVTSAPSSPAVATRAQGENEPEGLVPLDAADSLDLSADLQKTIQEARARVPEKLSSEQRAALEDLESRYERLEALALEESPEEPGMPRDRTPYARVLAGYYWEKLRLFSPGLDSETPEELVNAFLASGPRRE
ncbi:hypothetical protein HY251_15515 [bacterium]|nr:hypothetical protein [bacterium]